MIRLSILIALVLGAVMTVPVARGSAVPAAVPSQSEVRALWVARTTLGSPAAIAKMVECARTSGFNTLLVQVRARGDAYFAGGVEPRAASLAGQPDTFDPLQTVLAEAHRAGVRVHAWINVNLVSSLVDLPASRSHIIYRHPEWLMVPRVVAKEMRVLNPRSPLYLDRLVRTLRQQPDDVEGLYMSPIAPAAADYVAALVGDLSARYAVDGVHLDYVRYPNEEFDYSATALSQFATEVARDLSIGEAERLRTRESTNPFAFTDMFPERWREFRRGRLTALVNRVRAAVKAARPHALLTAAVVPDADDAAEHRLQDWRAWLADGTLDIACPMAYAADLAGVTAQITAVRQAAGARPFWAGIGAYRLSPSQTIESIRAARRLGAAGIILFSYDSLAASRSNGQSLAEIGRAVFTQPPS